MIIKSHYHLRQWGRWSMCDRPPDATLVKFRLALIYSTGTITLILIYLILTQSYANPTLNHLTLTQNIITGASRVGGVKYYTAAVHYFTAT